MGPHHRIGIGQGPGHRPGYGGVPAVGLIGQRQQGVATQVPRLALGDVPAPVAAQQFVVVGGQHPEQVDGRLAGLGCRWRRTLGRPKVDGADILAITQP